ncbi:sarcosine oxidase subunit beta family protein [Marivibrio halodurans]|uniref:Sarcosine oxidase subunit beta family protein n=1 Tax=Marivibrio halodurans TaxID=2039722 RepID=A0A8J7V1S4_9PROT|nr:sarcosine oxidase subunit beta family protein [Marivibrio halodurans]MBP5856406.1 sarcosine oxidase subunit beta family protein [Marivibrio halodurans]
MGEYSVWSVLKGGFTAQRHWKPAWRDPDPKPAYDALIVGGGGHGLASAFYLAKLHGMRNIAVLEKGWLGGGNTGRNTTIVRSNYMLEGNAHFYEKSLQLWEGLSQELGYNVMFSQRGVINLAHSDAQMDAYARRGNAMRLNGIDAELLSREEVRARAPMCDFSDKARFPIHGGLLQPRGGTARHDAVAWGFAHAADRLGVDIIQNCEVTGIDVEQGRVTGVQTTRGAIKAPKIGLAVAGHTTQLAEMASLRLPIESHLLQAMVSEPLKPWIDTVVTFGAGHFYISQSDKGGLVFGGDLDGYNSFAQRGNMPTVEHVIQCGVALMPGLKRLRLLRHWGGVMDMTMDGSPIIGRTPVEGLYLNGGWCYGGFKATPGSGWVFAHTIAQDRPHKLNEALGLERFETGALLDERGAGPVPGWH